eukprot:10934758-Ditylum_brightwellii.AAC.1
MPQYVQIKENNKQSIIKITNASGSRKLSSHELTRRQHKRKKTIKARNLRDTTIESYFNKKRVGKNLFEESQQKEE